MRILWICGADIVGGAERVTLPLLESLRRRGHSLHAMHAVRSPLAASLEVAGIPATPAPLHWTFNPRAISAVGRVCDTFQPHIALVTTAAQWPTACLAPRRRGTRLVLVRHMALPLRLPVRLLAAARADAVIAVSMAVRQALLARKGIPPTRVHVLLNAVRFPPRAAVPTATERAATREVLGLPHGQRWVGFFGGLDRAKGLEDVLFAVQTASRTAGDINLLICGRGSEASRLLLVQRVADLQLQGRVHYLGDTDNVVDALTAVDVVVMATRSTLSEALPATLTEAMACGTPVIGYATGGIPEVIGPDGECGRLAAADDIRDLARTLIEVLLDPQRAAARATAALQRVRDLFDPEQAADRYEQLFAGLRQHRTSNSTLD